MRIRTVMAATVVAVGATLALAGAASASTPTHGGGGGSDAVTCGVATRTAQAGGADERRVIVTRPVQGVDARQGRVVDDAGRTLAVEDWSIDDGGRVVGRAGQIIAERGWIVCGPDHVIEARPGDCPGGVAGTHTVHAVPAQPGERIEMFRVAPRN